MGFGTRLMIVLALACIILVSGLSYAYFSRPRVFERNLVGVIRVDGAITSTEVTGRITTAINWAIQNSSVKAVVLSIDSPGGFAHLVEQVYLDALALKERKPVVASVVSALSGGYYIAVAADYIYVHPTSMVGNVGVIGVAPDNFLPSEKNLETGPYKAAGFSRLLFPFNLSHALDNFAGAVEEGRGGRLKLSSLELRKGMIYLGSEAVEVGLVDAIGSLQKAADHAASEAGLVTYRLVDIPPNAEAAGVSTSNTNRTSIPWRELTVASLNSINPPPAIYYIYLPPNAFEEGSFSVASITQEGVDGAPVAMGTGQMVVDLSHGNKVSPLDLNLLSAELAMRGVYTGYSATWDEVELALKTASCILIAAPTKTYSKDEFNTIEEFLNKGRMLLMFYDPSSEYVDSKSLLGPINSLANRYGLTFGNGYLYNTKDHYGLYRNIYVRSFKNNSITSGLETLVLFTSTFLYSTDSDAAWASAGTYTSVAERSGNYAPISIISKGNGTVAAFGDLTFLMEPFSYVEDNYKMVMNIVSVISGIKVPIVEEPEKPEYNVTEPDLPIGTVKHYKETVDGEEQDVWWLRTGENEIQVERPDMTITYYYDEDGNLLSWDSEDMAMSYDPPLPNLPYPLIDGKGWTYRVNYNLTLKEDEEKFSGKIEGHGRVLGFEELEPKKGKKYFCAKISVSETDELSRRAQNITAVSSETLWMSSEAGLVKSETFISYYIDGQLAFEETRTLILITITQAEVKET